MDKKYFEIYENLYFDYIYDGDRYSKLYYPYSIYEYYSLITLVRRSIDKTDKENILRPDAKFYLLVNFDNLIIKPLFMEREPRSLNNDLFLKLGKSIQSDIRAIIEASQKSYDGKFEKKESEISEEILRERQVSGHRIMETINELWKDLKTAQFEIWG